jgi:FkbM family methyltransferase
MGFKFNVREYPIFGTDGEQKWNHTHFPADEIVHNVLDIGGYDASFAKACVERWPDCQVWAVEPNPFLHYHYNDLKNITLVDGALSYHEDKNVMNIRGAVEEDGEVFDNFYESDLTYAGRTEKHFEVDTRHYTLTELLGLADFDVVKINCCGGEHDLINRPSEFHGLSSVKYIMGATWGNKVRNPDEERKLREQKLCEYKFTNMLYRELSNTHETIAYCNFDRCSSLGLFYCRKKDS